MRKNSRVHHFNKGGYVYLFNPDNMESFRCSSDIEPKRCSNYKDLFKESTDANINYEKREQLELVLNVSQECNLQCSYCFSLNQERRIMDENVAEKSLEYFFDAFEFDSLKLHFFGGEPLTNFRTIIFAVEKARQLSETYNLDSPKFSVVTNGTLITKDMANYFSVNNFEVQVSLDGPKEVHDRFRLLKCGKGSHDRVIKGLKLLQKHKGIKISTSSVITKSSDIKNVYSYLEASVSSIKNMKLDMVYDFHESNTPEFASTEKDFQNNYVGHFDFLVSEYINKLKNFQRPSEYNFTHSVLLLWGKQNKYRYCPAASSRFSIDTEGKIYPCGGAASLREYAIGNIHEGLDSALSDRFDDNLNIHFKEPCNSCWAKPLCLGGCPLTLRNGTNRQHCDIRKAMVEGAIEIYTTIRDENPFAFTVLVDENFSESLRELL